MPQLLRLLLILSLVMVSHLVPPLVAAIVSSPAPAALSLPGCPSKCGDVDIPYPFGMRAECAWQGEGGGFTVYCNESSSSSPRPYIGNIEIKNISVETGEMHVFTLIASRCFNSSTTISSEETIGWTIPDPFRISPTKNIFTAIGCYTVALLDGNMGESSYKTGCISYCEADSVNAAKDGAQCTGLGCCQTTSIPAKLTNLVVNWGNTSADDAYNPAWEYSPCSYAFVAAKPWYNFQRADLGPMDEESFSRRFGDSNVPFVIEWAIMKNGSCQGGPQAKLTAPACVSANSECDNAAEGDGYICICSKGYQGNPYVHDGCQDIDECDFRKENPCASGSTCKNTLGDYKCKCNNKFLQKGDGRSAKGCHSRFSVPVIAAVVTFAIVVVVCIVFIDYKRRKQRRFFDKNGGEILKSMGINIFTEQQLKKITNSYKEAIGEGAFGKVYIGTIDEGNQRVAVKRATAKGEALPQAEFVNEITFQFRISHANLVRLVGCCLETDVPMLVFELISKGSLFNVLHGAADPEALRLIERVDIATGSAEALAYMHSHGGQNHVHGDIKSGNILLSDDLTPKVSDFGSSKLVSVASMYSKWCVLGDMSYIDPVYIKSGRFTEKSDVYSFGVVLLELITRKKARYGNRSLPLDFVKCWKDEGNGRKLYDKDILSDDDAQAHRHMECLERIGALAVRCLKEDVDERPTMAEVLDELKQVKAIASGGSSPSVAS